MAIAKVIISNRQKEIKIPAGVRLLMRRCCQAVLQTEGFPEPVEICISFISNEEIKKLNREDGITIVLITHYMDEAVKADRVIVMDDGKILTEGTPKEVFSQVDLIKVHSLDVPQATEICYELQKAGVNIKELPLDEESCVDVLMEVLK